MQDDAEGAAWERARRLREAEQAEAARRLEEQTRATQRAVAEAEELERRQGRRNLVVGVAGFAAVLVVAAASFVWLGDQDDREASSAGPASVQDAAGDAPDRLIPAVGGGSATTSGSPTSSAPNRLDATERPRIDTTGDDFDRIWRQAQLMEGWLLRHPDPALAAEIYVPDSEASVRVVELLSQLRRDGQKVEVHDYRIIEVTLEERVSEDGATVRYSDTYTGRDLLDAATGEVLQHEDYDGRPRLWEMEMQRGDDGRWRVLRIEFVEFGPPV